MIKILWLAPNFNHYKARFLNHLAEERDVSLTILSGLGRDNMGDQEIDGNWGFEHIKVNVPKKNFGKSKIVKSEVKAIFGNFDWVLIPAEKKNLPLFLYALKLRKQNPSVRLFSYNHAKLKSQNGFLGILDYKLSKFFNTKLDRVVYYTEAASKQAIQDNLVTSEKAFWAKNTVDNTEIDTYYNFQLPPEQQTILFIGRLIPSKRISDVIAYYKALKPNFEHLKLEIIGDGPEHTIVQEAIKKDSHITWHGTLVDEAQIAPIMKRASFVFVPGLSGLSINHAFAYGRPYVTLKADKHGPEISYLEDGKNGYILKSNLEENIQAIVNLLGNRDLLIDFCEKAKEKGDQLSVSNWVQQMKNSLMHE